MTTGSASEPNVHALWRLQEEETKKTRRPTGVLLVEDVHKAWAWIEESFGGETRQGSLSVSLMDPARNLTTCRPPMTWLANNLSRTCQGPANHDSTNNKTTRLSLRLNPHEKLATCYAILELELAAPRPLRLASSSLKLPMFFGHGALT